MMSSMAFLQSIWWLMYKDLTREFRAYHMWPSTVLVGLVLVFLLAIQIDLPPEFKGGVGGGLLWVAIAFSGVLALERSFSSERDAGCWQVLVQYPIAPSALFLAKMSLNVVSLVLLELVLIPLFLVMTDLPLLARPLSLALIAGLGNIGFAAAGTLISAVTANLNNRGGQMALLLLPLVIPVILASAEATRMLLAGSTGDEWSRWLQLLAVFAVVFTVLGAMVFEVVIEE